MTVPLVNIVAAKIITEICSRTLQINVVLVHKLEDCGLACVNHCSCFSFNIAIRLDKNGHFVCELLATDKYNETSKFVASGDFHHFSIAVRLVVH